MKTVLWFFGIIIGLAVAMVILVVWTNATMNSDHEWMAFLSPLGIIAVVCLAGALFMMWKLAEKLSGKD